MSQKIRNSYKKVKNGRRNTNFGETAVKTKSWEYILPMRIRIMIKLKCHYYNDTWRLS